MAALFLALLSSNAEACFLGQCFKRLFGGNDEQDTVVIVVQPRAPQAPVARQPVAGPQLQLAVRPPAPAPWPSSDRERAFEIAYPHIYTMTEEQKRARLATWLRAMGSATGGAGNNRFYEFSVPRAGGRRPVYSISVQHTVQSGLLTATIAAPSTGSVEYETLALTTGAPTTETMLGLWARTWQALGGNGVDSMRVNFGDDNWPDLQEYLQNRTLGLRDVAAASQTDSARFILAFYGLAPTNVYADGDAYSVLFRPHQAIESVLPRNRPDRPDIADVENDESDPHEEELSKLMKDVMDDNDGMEHHDEEEKMDEEPMTRGGNP